jgi:hypothetical protein
MWSGIKGRDERVVISRMVVVVAIILFLGFGTLE